MKTCPKCGTDNPDGASFCIECSQKLTPKLDDIAYAQTGPFPSDEPEPAPSGKLELEPGDMFAGRYEIVSRIGQGGMGVVYRAKEELAGRPRDIALKLIRADRLSGQAQIDKLLNEGALTQDIRHPNVVTVYNVGNADGQPFVAMQYVDGVSLREWRRNRAADGQAIELPLAAAIVRSLLDGLEAAHEMRIVHRDLKPENVILTGEPTPESARLQILDFGIAHAPGERTSATATGLGTLGYMAPEQQTDPDLVGPPADLYSLSVIFYQLLMDVLPQGHWQPPSGGRPDVPTAIDALIEKGLSNRPASRQQSVGEYREELARALDQTPVIHRGNVGKRESETSSVRHVESWFGRHKKAVIGGGAAAALLLVIAGIDDEPIIKDGTDAFDETQLDPLDLADPQEIADLSDDELADGTVPDTPVTPQRPENTGTSPDLSILSGRWNYAGGQSYSIDVAANGNFAGNGTSADGVPVRIEGSLANGTYVVGNDAIALRGSIGAGSDACHLNFVTFNPDGSVNYQDVFHIDHSPGGPCPARLQQ